MFNPDPESDAVKKLKDSLKIAEGEDKSDEQPQTEDANKRKRRHGVGFKLKKTVNKSVEQLKLLSKFNGDAKKRAAQNPNHTNNIPKTLPTLEPEDESRLDLIFKRFKKKK